MDDGKSIGSTTEFGWCNFKHENIQECDNRPFWILLNDPKSCYEVNRRLCKNNNFGSSTVKFLVLPQIMHNLKRCCHNFMEVSWLPNIATSKFEWSFLCLSSIIVLSVLYFHINILRNYQNSTFRSFRLIRFSILINVTLHPIQERVTNFQPGRECLIPLCYWLTN